MRLKLTIVDDGGAARDVVVTADVTATIAQVAQRLAGGPDGQRPLTLRAEYPGRTTARVLRPGASVHESGLRSGCRVQVVPVGTHRAGDEIDPAATVLLRVVAGPAAGLELPLANGVHVLGRAAGSDIALGADHEVSRRHATLTVGDSVQLTDLNSANGVSVDGRAVQRAILTPASRVRIGSSELLVVPLTPDAATAGALPPGTDHWDDAAFSRSPRVEPVYRGREFVFPQLPALGDQPRLPVLALIAPVVAGIGMYLFTHQLFTLMFIALSPVILLGTWIDGRTRGRRRKRQEEQRFADGMADITQRLAAERESEATARVAESPSIGDVMHAIGARTDLLWTRKPEHPSFLTVRFGLGRLPSRNRLVPPLPVLGRTSEQELIDALVAEHSEVAGVPVLESLGRAGSLGVAGTVPFAGDVARALVLQLAGLHSPADLTVTAFAGGETTRAWEWLKWLPHANSAYSPIEADGLAADFAAGTALLAELEELVDRRQSARHGGGVRSRLGDDGPLDLARVGAVEALPATPAVLVLVTEQPPAERARLVALAEKGADCGVHLIWLAPRVTALPSVCRTFVDVQGPSDTSVGFVRNGRAVPLSFVDFADPVMAATAARDLAPVEDVGARVLDESDLPHDVSFVELYEDEIADSPSAVARRWVKNDSVTGGWHAGAAREPGGLHAVVGQGPVEPVALDLRAHGPHALVGGTTGSGKSEFLQSWIMGLATEYSPDRVTFLLVDYKGGSAFADCVLLPHTVGLVTDLTPHLVRRALTSLRAELRHRERLLNAKGAKDLLTLERRSDPDAPPVLIIVIDEFAALVGEVPEFVDGVIDVAQRGRSLGIHLVMATQRPSGVIRDNLRANTNLRVALRVADEADSVDVLGVKDAAAFSPATPGRAAAKLGPGRVVDFQSAYLGGRTAAGAGADDPDLHIVDLPFGTGSAWPEPTRTRRMQGDRDIERLARSIRAAAAEQGVRAPRKPWLDPLPAVIDLAALTRPDGAEAFPIGVADEPAEQSQEPWLLDLDEAGNVGLVGTGGAGKSATLRTIAVALSRDAARHPVAVYGVDAAGGSLRPLEALPTVGAVIDGSDSERLVRLARQLTAELARRARLFSAARAASIADYRRLTGDPLPRIVVMIDGFGGFRADYEFALRTPVFGPFLAAATTGRQFGVHLVVAADRAAAFPTVLRAALGTQLVMRLSGPQEYLNAGLPGDVLEDAPEGRALADRVEVQFAVPGGSPDLIDQAAAIEQLAAELRRTGVPAAEPVRRLPELVPADELPRVVDGRPVIGLADDTLGPLGFPLDGVFVVSGPSGSGRTSAMRTAIGSALAVDPGLRPYLFSGRRSALGDAAVWADAAGDGETAAALADRVADLIDAAEAGEADRPLLVIENIGDFEGTPAESRLVRLLKTARRAGTAVLAEADTITAPMAWQLYGELKSARAGLTLQPDEGDGLALFRVQLPRATRADYPQGRGFLIESGRIRRVQVALPVAPRPPIGLP